MATAAVAAEMAEAPPSGAKAASGAATPTEARVPAPDPLGGPLSGPALVEFRRQYRLMRRARLGNVTAGMTTLPSASSPSSPPPAAALLSLNDQPPQLAPTTQAPTPQCVALVGRDWGRPRRFVAVVARWREEVGWTRALPVPALVYGHAVPRGEPGGLHSVPVNKGSEASAYLQFIVDHYACLPAWVLFLHGHGSTLGRGSGPGSKRHHPTDPSAMAGLVDVAALGLPFISLGHLSPADAAAFLHPAAAAFVRGPRPVLPPPRPEAEGPWDRAAGPAASAAMAPAASSRLPATPAWGRGAAAGGGSGGGGSGSGNENGNGNRNGNGTAAALVPPAPQRWWHPAAFVPVAEHKKGCGCRLLKKILPGSPCVPRGWGVGAEFWASKGAILARPLAFWERLLRESLQGPDVPRYGHRAVEGSKATEAGYCFEALWPEIFDPDGSGVYGGGGGGALGFTPPFRYIEELPRVTFGERCVAAGGKVAKTPDAARTCEFRLGGPAGGAGGL